MAHGRGATVEAPETGSLAHPPHTREWDPDDQGVTPERREEGRIGVSHFGYDERTGESHFGHEEIHHYPPNSPELNEEGEIEEGEAEEGKAAGGEAERHGVPTPPSSALPPTYLTD